MHGKARSSLKLSISASEGKTLILRIAKPGEILGLPAVMSGTPYEMTAETPAIPFPVSRLFGSSIGSPARSQKAVGARRSREGRRYSCERRQSSARGARGDR